MGFNNLAGGGPSALLWRHRNDASIGAGSHAIGVAESGRHGLGGLAIRCDPVNALRVGVIELTAMVYLETGDVVVSTQRGRNAVVKGRVEIRHTVAIEIVQTRDAVLAQDVHLITANLQPERLEQARGHAFPVQRLQTRIDARHQPNIAMNGAHIARTVGREVHTGGKEQRAIGVVVREGESVHGEGPRLQAPQPPSHLLSHVRSCQNVLRLHAQGFLCLSPSVKLGRCIRSTAPQDEVQGNRCTGLERQHSGTLGYTAGLPSRRIQL